MNFKISLQKREDISHKLFTLLIIITVAIAVAKFIENPSLPYALLFGVIAVSLLIHQYNEAGLIILIFIITLFRESPYTPLDVQLYHAGQFKTFYSFGPYRPNIIEILIVLSLIIWLFKSIVEQGSDFHFKTSSFNKPMAVFAGAGIIAIFVGLYNGGSPHDIFLEWRPLTYIPAIYFVTVNIVLNPWH